jgi:hypothetical protein
MDNTEKIRRRYDRASRVYDLFEQPMEAMSLKYIGTVLRIFLLMKILKT